MVVTAVDIVVKPEHIADFIQASITNHEASVQEAGNMRFDILQSSEDPARFLFYEAYQTEGQSAAHKKTAHYLAWRDTVGSWMVQPRSGKPYAAVRP